MLVLSLLFASAALRAAEIHDAVEAGNVAKVKQMVAADPSAVNVQSDGGVTPLHLAAGLNNKTLIRFLISKGADLRATTKQGWTPLAWAARMNASDSVAILVSEYGADPSEACKIFEKLVSEDPENVKYNYAFGLICLAMKDYSRSAESLKKVLKKEPGNDRARVELALCLKEMKRFREAKEEFLKVKSNIDTRMAGLAQNSMELIRERNARNKIDGQLLEIEQGSRRWQYSGRIDAMYFNDSNVNVGPDSARISISPIIFGSQTISELTVQQASMPAKSEGYAMSVFADSVYDAGEQGKWGWGTTIGYYQNWLDKNEQYESLFCQLDNGPRYFGQRSYFQAPLRLAYIATGGNSLVDLYGIHPAYVYAYGPSGEWRFATLTSLEGRDYEKLNDRDGCYVSAGEVIRHYFGRDKHSILMGLTFAHDFTRSAVYEYTSREWQFGFDFKLPWQTVLYGRLRYVVSDYSERETLAPSDRNDSQNQYTIGLSKMITPHWGMDANFQQTDNTSSFALYQYDRHVATISAFCIF